VTSFSAIAVFIEAATARSRFDSAIDTALVAKDATANACCASCTALPSLESLSNPAKRNASAASCATRARSSATASAAAFAFVAARVAAAFAFYSLASACVALQFAFKVSILAKRVRPADAASCPTWRYDEDDVFLLISCSRSRSRVDVAAFENAVSVTDAFS